jgi:hypothetical protein
MKLTARIVPYSSVVGGGVMLLDEAGKAYLQLAVMGGRVGVTREEHEATAAALVELVNAEGLVIGETPDEKAQNKIRANLDKLRSWMPSYMRDGMERYVLNGLMPGSFLTAILEGDEVRAKQMADVNNRRLVDEYFAKVRELLPPACYGNPAQVKAWSDRGGLRGRKGENDNG